MIETEPYAAAVDQLLQLGFSHEIHRSVTNIVEHHVFSDPEVPIRESVRIATIVMTELHTISESNHATVAADLGRKLMERVTYWEGASPLRYDTFDGSNAVRLSPIETAKLFYTLRHIATTFIDVLSGVPLYHNSPHSAEAE